MPIVWFVCRCLALVVLASLLTSVLWRTLGQALIVQGAAWSTVQLIMNAVTLPLFAGVLWLGLRRRFA